MCQERCRGWRNRHTPEQSRPKAKTARLPPQQITASAGRMRRKSLYREVAPNGKIYSLNDDRGLFSLFGNCPRTKSTASRLSAELEGYCTETVLSRAGEAKTSAGWGGGKRRGACCRFGIARLRSSSSSCRRRSVFALRARR
eukprot:2406256-Pleurochrysis_carterae.AAC.2